MPLATGQILSSYEVLGPLGAGAMGEVYRARDTRLDREVALKVLPEELAADAERMRRFEREARVLASLNHPNIAQIFEIGEVDGLCFLVLELVPGEDLATRIARGRLSLAETIDCCRQIAEGLAAAHDSGVVHRDLKPANVRVTPDGTVKLLDFGLAKPNASSTADGASVSPARPDSFFVTEEGLVLGTPTYMSPEQARGRPVDRRTDVWAFGCVLFECLTGSRVFQGETVADVLAAIVEREPDLNRLPEGTPPRLVELLRQTLVKDPRQRLQHLGDARVELERVSDEPRASSSGPAPLRRRPGAPLLAGLAVGAVAGALAVWLATTDPPAPPGAGPASLAHLAVPIPEDRPSMHPRIAPDGGSLIYRSEETDAGGAKRPVLFLRRLDAAEPIRLPGTEFAETAAFSPDAGSLAVVLRSEAGGEAQFRLVRVILDEGSPRSVPLGPFAPDPNLSSGMVWTDAGLLVTTGNRNRLLTMPVEGGSWRELRITGLQGPSPYTPDVFRALPGGRYVLANAFEYRADGFSPQVLSIDVESGEARAIVDGGFAAWMPTGHLLFSRGETLLAARFDLDTQSLVDRPRVLFDGLRTAESWRSGWFDVTPGGTLVHEPGGLQGLRRRLAVSLESGLLEPWSREWWALDGMLSVAPDGSFLTTSVIDEGGLLELWGSEVNAPLLRPLLAAPETDFLPGPIDPHRGVFYFTRKGGDEPDGVWRAPIEHPERAERVWAPVEPIFDAIVLEMSPDGESLLVRVTDDEGTSLNEIRLADEGAPQVHRRFDLPADCLGARLSPDGRWLAYVGVMNGRSLLVLRQRRDDGSFGPVIPVPPDPAVAPGQDANYSWGVWARPKETAHPVLVAWSDGRRGLVEIDVLGDGPPQFSEPRLRLSLENRTFRNYQSLPDGGLILLERHEDEVTVDRIDVVLGVLSLLRD